MAGKHGVRAEHARIDALWLHPNAAQSLRHRVAIRYPSVTWYDDVSAMLAAHPLSDLPCYERVPRTHLLRRVAAVLGVAALLALGALPVDLLRGYPLLWDAWLVATGAIALLVGWLALGAHGAGHLAAAFVAAGVLAWLLAPLLGLPGWLLRVPLLRGAAVSTAGYLATLLPHHFPVIKTVRERPFCGVRA